jgi:hypothetical protein
MNQSGITVLKSGVMDLGGSNKLKFISKSGPWARRLKIAGVLVLVAFVTGILYGIAVERDKFTVEKINARPMDMRERAEYAQIFSDEQMREIFVYRLIGENLSSLDIRGLRHKYRVLVFDTMYSNPSSKVHIFINALPAEGEFGIEYRGR